MNPCTIVTLTSIYITTCLSITSARSTDPGGNPNLPSLKSQFPNRKSVSASTVTTTQIDIFLTKKQSTNQVEYKKEDNVETYTAKEGFAIQSFTDTDGVKWKTQGTKQLKGIKKTSLSNTTYVYQTAKYNPLIKYHFQHVVKFEKDDNLFKYTFQSGIKSLGFNYDGKEVVNHDAGTPIPDSVYLSIKGATAIVNFKDYRNILRFDGHEWKPIFSGKAVLNSINVQFKRGCDNYECETKNNVFTYTPKGNALFNKVRSKEENGTQEIIFETTDILEMANKVVYNEVDSNDLTVNIHHISGLTKTFKKESGKWKVFETTDSGITLKSDKVEIRIEHEEPSIDEPETHEIFTTQTVTYIDLDLTKTESTHQYEYKQEGDVETYTAKPGFAFKKYTDGPKVSWESDGTKYYRGVKRTKQADGKYRYQAARFNPDQLKVKILTQDPNDPTKLKENDFTQYALKQSNDLLEYKFKENVKCISIGYDRKHIWKYEASNSECPYPISVLFNISKKTILVVFKDTISIHQFVDEQWKTSFSGKPEGVELDTRLRETKKEWDYSKSGTFGTHIAKPGYFFNIVKAYKNEVWKTNSITEYATKVVVFGFENRPKDMTIYLVNGTTKCFTKPGKDKEWSPIISTNNLQPVELDVNTSTGTDKFDAVITQDVSHKFVAKPGLGFNVIKKGDEKIWEAEDKSEYATKVLFWLSNYSRFRAHHIYLASGEIIYLDKPDKDKLVESENEENSFSTQASGNDSKRLVSSRSCCSPFPRQQMASITQSC